MRGIFGIATYLVLLGSGAAALGAEPAGRSYARSVVASRGGIVATSQVIASRIGTDILARGGSAVDAAIAANLALSVLEPTMNGPGGDLFALYRDARTGAFTGLNASGGAPAGHTAARLRARGLAEVPTTGIETVTVPGGVAGWAALHQRYGKLPWRELFIPAARLARDGFAVAERIAAFWQAFVPASCTDAECRRVLLPAGRAPAFGEWFRNPDMARTLELLGRKGAQVFYRGEIARAMVATSTRLGGTLTLADLAGYRPEWVQPIATEYRGWSVLQLPPNSRGAVVLEALNLLQTFPAPAGGPTGADAMHLRIETMRLANADRIHMTDPRFGGRPVDWLLTREYAAQRAARIDLARAACVHEPGRPPPRSDTTFIAVVDAQGNMISLIQSLATGDSGVVVDGHGFLMQDRGVYFSLDPADPNVLAPGKRTSHTLMPAHMQRGDEHIAFGFVGGTGQPAGQLQFISDVVDYGLNIQAALETPQLAPIRDCRVTVEERAPVASIEALRRRGHEVEVTPAYDDMMTLGQAVQWNSSTGMKFGASSPRADGAALSTDR